jgi:hypothetical protein
MVVKESVRLTENGRDTEHAAGAREERLGRHGDEEEVES